VAHALLRWSQATHSAPPESALELLERLVPLRRKSGRWPVREGSREVWPGWCNGSAGWAQTWALAWHLTGEDGYLRLAEFCARDALDANELNASLCCGRAGHGFAALSLYRTTGEARWLSAAETAAAQAALMPDHGEPPYRLFSGSLGAALLDVELRDPSRSAMPVYESIG
jgi:serine/threonine-protein kinase